MQPYIKRCLNTIEMCNSDTSMNASIESARDMVNKVAAFENVNTDIAIPFDSSIALVKDSKLAKEFQTLSCTMKWNLVTQGVWTGAMESVLSGVHMLEFLYIDSEQSYCFTARHNSLYFIISGTAHWEIAQQNVPEYSAGNILTAKKEDSVSVSSLYTPVVVLIVKSANQ